MSRNTAPAVHFCDAGHTAAAEGWGMLMQLVGREVSISHAGISSIQ
jgi:hypothetical protein